MNSNDSKFKLNIDRNMILFAILIIGISLTIVYIFYTSTAFLTSDSVITDVIAHQQKIHGQFILSNWYYGNEFWLFSLTVPTYLLSFVIKDNLLLRQICVLITTIIFFILLYIYGKKFLNKKDNIMLLTIFSTGISYSVLDYFYSFNAYLTVIINSMLLLYVYFKTFNEKNNKKRYYVLSLILTFMFSVGSLRYLPSVTAPFIITELILVFIDNYNKDLRKVYNNTKIAKIFGIVIVVIVSLIGYYLLTNTYHFETRAATGDYIKLTTDNLIKNVGSVFECLFNFFGYDNKSHPYTFMVGTGYFLEWNKNYSIYSISGMFNFIKFIASILFIVVVPVALFKKYKNKDKNINFLLIFNTISWMIMIYLFVFSDSFFHNYSECKYFLFNIIINIILSIYCVYKYFSINKNFKIIFDIFFILYIISNLYQTYIVVMEHNKTVVDSRYELTKTLQANNLTFGYGNFWAGLMTNFLSDYKIEIASVELKDEIVPDKWYSDSKLYNKNYHNGKTFLVLNSYEYENYSGIYIEKYGKPDDVLVSGVNYIYVYNKNPFKKILD